MVRKRPEVSPYALPKTVVVGPFHYDVHLWKEADAVSSEAAGLCDSHRNAILIKENLNDQTRAEVLMHETLHAIFYTSGLTMVSTGVGQSEEMIVSQLALGLVALIRANPDFMPLITRLLERDAR